MSNTPIGRSFARHSESMWNEKGASRPPNYFVALSLAATEIWRRVLDCAEDVELHDAVLADRTARFAGEEVIDIVRIRITHVKPSGRQVNEVTASNPRRRIS